MKWTEMVKQQVTGEPGGCWNFENIIKWKRWEFNNVSTARYLLLAPFSLSPVCAMSGCCLAYAAPIAPPAFVFSPVHLGT